MIFAWRCNIIYKKVNIFENFCAALQTAADWLGLQSCSVHVHMAAVHAYQSATISLFMYPLQIPSHPVKARPHQECVFVRLLQSRMHTMHCESVCWNASPIYCPWPCPFQTSSHLCEIAQQRAERRTERAVSKALWTLRPTGTPQ